MEFDALMELLGLRPRPAKAASSQGEEAAARPAPNPALADYPGYQSDYEAPGEDRDLMEILRRNQADSTVDTEIPSALPQSTAALAEDAGEIERLARDTRDIEASIAQAMEQQQRRQAMTPEMFSGAPPVGAPPPLPAPRPMPAPQPQIAGPSAPQFAHLDRGGGPFRPVGPTPQAPPALRPVPPPLPQRPIIDPQGGLRPRGAPAPQLQPQPAPVTPPQPSAPQYASLDRSGGPFVPANQGPRPPVNLAQAAPPTPPRPQQVAPPANPIINQGPFQSPGPGNPFQPPPHPMARVTPPPANAGGPQPSAPPMPAFPFGPPAAADPLAQPVSGGPILRQPTPMAPQPASSTGPFRPQGPVVDAFMNGVRPVPQIPPTAMGGPTTPTPIAAMPQTRNENLITQGLNRQELERIQSLSPVAQPTPPAPNAPTVPPMASVPPPAPIQVPQGATPASPPPAPAVGEQLPPHIRDSILAEALRLTAERRGTPQQLGPR